jgi:hypothetical protein
MQVATVGRSTDSARYRPRTPLQDAPIFHRQCARNLKTKTSSTQLWLKQKYGGACSFVFKRPYEICALALLECCFLA